MFQIMSNNDGILNAIIFDEIDRLTLAGLTQVFGEIEPKGMDLTIASLGGDIDVGFAIYDILDAWSKDHALRIHASGTVASAAILPFCLPVHRDAAPGSFFIIHSVSAGDFGDAAKFAKLAAILDKYDERLVEIYKRVVTLSEDELLKYIRAETMFSAEIALEWGFLSELRPQDARASGGPVDFFHISGGIMSIKKNELSPDEIEQVKEVIVETEQVEEVKEEEKERVDEDAPAEDADRISRLEAAIEKLSKDIAALMESRERAENAPIDFLSAKKNTKKPSVYDKSGLKFR